MGLPNLYIFDVDGTLCKMWPDRRPYDWHLVGRDTRNEAICRIAWMLLEAGQKIAYISGRSEECRAATETWLDDNVHLSDPDNVVGLFMRDAGDYRPDVDVKRELYRRHIEGKYNVVAVFDDRDAVVELWRKELGLTCLQVDYGDF